MTTIVAVRKHQHVVLAADSQTSFGDTRLAAHYDADSDKIFRYHNNLIGISGSAAHDLVLKHLLSQHKQSFDFSSKAAIFASFKKLHPILKEKYFLSPGEDEDDAYESSQMTILIANPHGIFGVYSLREVFEFQKFWAIGSGREFALGAMFAHYSGAATAADVARMGVQAGAEFDTGSALPLTLYSHELQVD